MKRRTFLKFAIGGLSAFAVGVGLRRKTLSLYLVSDSEDTHVIAYSEADALEVMKEEFGIGDDDLESIESVTIVDERQMIDVRFDSLADYPKIFEPLADSQILEFNNGGVKVWRHAIDWIDEYGRGVLCCTAW